VHVCCVTAWVSARHPVPVNLWCGVLTHTASACPDARRLTIVLGRDGPRCSAGAASAKARLSTSAHNRNILGRHVIHIFSSIFLSIFLSIFSSIFSSIIVLIWPIYVQCIRVGQFFTLPKKRVHIKKAVLNSLYTYFLVSTRPWRTFFCLVYTCRTIFYRDFTRKTSACTPKTLF
jgi:hypothetical protein